jgi:hypothetical protein
MMTDTVTLSNFTVTKSANVPVSAGYDMSKTSENFGGLHIRLIKTGWDGKQLVRDVKNGRVPQEKEWNE